MKDVTSDNFGIAIAYLLSGFVTLWAISRFSPTVQSWLGAGSADAASVGGFLYVTLASLGLGVFVSTIRWLVVDRLLHRTGIHEPQWDFSRLQDQRDGFGILVRSHYFYFKFHANLLVASAFAYGVFVATRELRTPLVGPTLSFVLLELVLWLGARDTLSKYYSRGAALLRTRGTANGEGHDRTKRGLKVEGPFR